MRRIRTLSRLAPVLLLALGVSSVPLSAHAQGDFDPRGRHRPTPRPGPTPTPRPGAPGPRPTPGPRPPTPDPQVSPEGASAVLIERYTKIVLAQPGSPFPLQRLAQLYRDKDGNLTVLVADFERRAGAAGPEQYASTVTLAGVYKIDGRPEDAIKTYEKAIAQKASEPTALMALARLLQDRGDSAGARARYEQALALQTVAGEKEQTLRTLMSLALDAKDWNAAKTFHTQLVKMQANQSLFVRGDLGRELYQRGEYERAESEFKDLVTASQGDNRTLAPALKDLGKAQAKAHKNQEALATLKHALTTAGQEAAVRAEIYETITEIYRADQQLPVLVKQLEAEHPSDFARLAILGALYEETGDAVNALATYKRALGVNPRHIDLRLKMIRLLQSQGELDKAIAEYEGLIRAAPNNPAFVFEQCDALMQRGDRTRALKLLTELESRASTDEEVLSRLADFYGRIGEGDRSLKVLTRLTQIGQNDPSHLVDLGDRYFQDGNTALAVTTWKRILTTVAPRARALAAIGDVYLEHDMTADALTAFREAVQLDPQNLAFKKQLASALERTRSYRDARLLWQELADKGKASGDKVLAREARSRIVTLWGLERLLETQVSPLTAQFGANPPNIEAGRMLAEVQLHMQKLTDAEATLRKVVQLAPGDADSYLALERVLVKNGKFPEAIAVLEKLVAVEPKRARELFQRMAEYAQQLRQDDNAIKYAARAVELNPDDAEGHRRLGDRYKTRQDVDHAIVEYRAAIAKNDRLYTVYVDLGNLLYSKGDADEADRLFRRVLRAAPDEELVARAARLSININMGKGTLEALEQELLPLSIGNPQKPIYRRLLVEVYGYLSFGLVQRVKHGSGKDAEEARTALTRVGARAVKPLLDALADGDAGQQRVAIDVLGYVQNKNAGPSLFAFATGPGDTSLRVRAMIACGALKDAAMLPKYEGLLFPHAGTSLEEATPGDTVAVAATWGAARMGDKRALPLLRKLAQRGTPEMRALAVLGLGQQKDKASVAQISAMARAVDVGNVARAAAAYVLGELGADAEIATLLNMAEGNDALPRQMALLALARMAEGRAKNEPPGGRAALSAMADAVFAGSESENGRARLSAEALRRAGAAALVMLASHGSPQPGREMLPVPDDALDVEATLEQLVPRTLGAKERAAALVAYAEPLKRAAMSALQTSNERARAVLDALSAGDGALDPFVGIEETPETALAHAKAKELALALEPSVLTLARHPDPGMRTKAIVLLARSPSDGATGAVVLAVGDPNESVQRVALAAIGAHSNARAVAAVGKVVTTHENWAMRVLAVQAMGRLGAAGNAADATRILKDSATRDPYALVREAALVAVSSYDPKTALPLATTLATTDAEPRVRDTARALSQGKRAP